MWRLLRSVGLLVVGAMAGFAGAAAVLRGILPSRGDPASDEVALVAIFDGIDLEIRSTAFRGGSVLAWFGGVSLDLREAALATNARLEVRAIFGGIAIRVPTTWRVELDGSAFAGGYDASNRQPPEPEAPTLSVRTVAAFGGVSVSN